MKKVWKGFLLFVLVLVCLASFTSTVWIILDGYAEYKVYKTQGYEFPVVHLMVSFIVSGITFYKLMNILEEISPSLK